MAADVVGGLTAAAGSRSPERMATGVATGTTQANRSDAAGVLLFST